MKSKKKYNRNKKASPYTLSKYMAGGTSIFDSFPEGGDTTLELPSEEGGVEMPYQMLGNMAAEGVDAIVPNQEMYGQELPSQGKAVGMGALKGAGTGAKIGSVVNPGIGTAVGAVAGAIVGGIGGSIKNKKVSKGIQDQISAIPANQSMNPYGVPSFEDGGMVNNPLINIEKGELNVDLKSGSVLDDYDTPRYKSHSKGKNKEHAGNFVESTENGVVIPKKWREEYLSNKDARQGIIRDVLNKQIDRELYGKDANGNAKSFAKMKEGGIQQYLYGGGDPLKEHEDNLKGFNPQGNPSDMFDSDFGTRDIDSLLDPIPNFPFQNIDYSKPGNYVENNPSRVSPGANKDLAAGLSWTYGNNSLIGNPQAGPTSQKKSDDSMWTTGNTIGAIGNVVGGLGPLAMTLANGMDRDETNEFANVEGAAINELSGIYGRGKENTFANIRRQSNIASNMNSNRTSSFASRLSNEQNIADNTQRNLGTTGLGYDTNEASTTSQLRMQGDIQDANGRQDRLNRLDQNRDNFYSNLSDNASNMGDMTQGFGKNLNQNTSNEAKLKVLQQISMDFTMGADGKYYFKGKEFKI